MVRGNVLQSGVSLCRRMVFCVFFGGAGMDGYDELWYGSNIIKRMYGQFLNAYSFLSLGDERRLDRFYPFLVR
jgi:hypothetical protein